MANNSGSNAKKTSCNQNLNSPGEQQFEFECSSSFSQLRISQTGSELKAEAGNTSSSNSGSALGHQSGNISEQPQPQKSPHVNQYWAYSQLPTNTPPTTIQNQAISQPVATSSFINTTGSTGNTVFSRALDNVNVSPPAKELSSICTGLIGPNGITPNYYRGLSSSQSGLQSAGQVYDQYGHGHFFTKKTLV